MTINKKIKTKYPELDEILDKLGIIEVISYGSFAGLSTEFHELKHIIRGEIDTINPMLPEDIEKLYEMIKEGE